MTKAFPPPLAQPSSDGQSVRQFNVVLTYNIASGNVRDAIDLAFSVFSDQSGGYVEIFEEGNGDAIIEGDMTDFPKVRATEDTVRETTEEPVDDGSDISDFDQIDVVFTYNTAVESPEDAFRLALTVAEERSGGYIEVFCNGDKDSVFECDLPVSPASRTPNTLVL